MFTEHGREKKTKNFYNLKQDLITHLEGRINQINSFYFAATLIMFKKKGQAVQIKETEVQAGKRINMQKEGIIAKYTLSL